MACLAGIVSLPAGATADVAILPVRVAGYPREQVEEQVRTSVERVLGTRAAHLETMAGPAGTVPITDACMTSPECRAGLVRDSYDELALIAVTRVSDVKARMHLRLFDARGAAVLDLSDEIMVADAERGARGLLTRAFAPASYAGVLELVGAPPGAEVLVEGLRIAGTTAAVGVGTHDVVVRVDGGVIWRSTAAVAFDRTTRVAVDVPAVARPGVTLGGWMATGIGVAAAGAAVGLLLVAGGDRPADGPAPQPPGVSAVASVLAVGAGGLAAVAAMTAVTLIVTGPADAPDLAPRLGVGASRAPRAASGG